jgi:hypothetical protein
MQVTDTRSRYPHSHLSVRFKLSLESCQTGHCQTHPSLYSDASRGSNQSTLVDALCFVARLTDLFLEIKVDYRLVREKTMS